MSETAITSEASVTTEQFMANMEKQAKKQRQVEVDSGLLLTNTEMCRRLGFTRQWLSGACRNHRLFSLDGPEGKPVYPAFFAHRKYDRAELEAVCKALGDIPGGSKWDFFTAPRLSLDGKTPLEAIVDGKLDVVLNAARAFADE